MADEKNPCDCKWGAKDVALILTAMGSLFFSYWNNRKLDTVDDRQTHQVEKAAEVKAVLDVKTTEADRKLGKIETLLYTPPDKRGAAPEPKKD